jgi:putative ABC transport system permease protein
VNSRPLLRVSGWWFRLLLRLYPQDFRDEMGNGMIETYLDRARENLDRSGALALMPLWVAALRDSLVNGLGERWHPAVSWRRSGNWGRDLELVTRRFLRTPVFFLAVLGTLTVGLGAFAVVYTSVDKILLEPMPYEDPNDLYFVWRDYSSYLDLDRGWLSGPDVAELQDAGDVIEAAAGLQIASPTFSLGDTSSPFQVELMLMSPNLFDLLGVAPALGRGFESDEVGPNRGSGVVLSHALWRRLGGDPSILGQEIWMSETPYNVIGVMPSDFRFVRHSSLGPPQEADVYVPFAFYLSEQNPNNGSFAGVIRARSGTSPEAVAAAVDAVGRVVDERDNRGRGLRLYPVGLQADLVAGVRPVLFALGLAGVFLLLILTVNLASLLLARAAEREREFAVSRALGANGVAVFRTILAEGFLLGIMGGATGALAGAWGARLLVALAPLDLPRREAITLDWEVAVVVVGVGASLGLLAAAVPAAWASRWSLASLLATTAVRGSGGSSRMRRGLIVAQVALSLVLLVAGALVARSFERLLAADPGFRSENVLTFFTVIGVRVFPEDDDALAFQDRVEQQVGALPGVTHVSATSALPLESSASQGRIAIPGAPGNTGDPDVDEPLVDQIMVRAGYVESMGMRVLQGRSFSESLDDGVHEALIDRYLAQQFFPSGNALGARIPLDGEASSMGSPVSLDGQFLTVVGVVDQARLYDLHQDGRPQLYMRAEDWKCRTSSCARTGIPER